MSKGSMIERFMLKHGAAAGKIGKMAGKGAELLGEGAELAAEHPGKTALGALGLGAAGGAAHHVMSEEDDLPTRAKHKIHELLDGIL